MGWFDEQVKERAKNDDDHFASAFSGMANILNNKNKKVQCKKIIDFMEGL